jgi:arylsulfatase A-like enzyme
VFFMVDDLGFNDVGFQDGRRSNVSAFKNNTNSILTPHIDALAHAGVVLGDYTVYKYCSPSRAQTLTGRYSYHLGTADDQVTRSTGEPCGYSTDYRMLPAMLKQAPVPYSTHMLGKWNQGFFTRRHTPTGRGFDSFFGFYDGGESYFTHVTPFSVWTRGAPYWWSPFQYDRPNESTFQALVDLSNNTASPPAESEGGGGGVGHGGHRPGPQPAAALNPDPDPDPAARALNGSFSMDLTREEAVRLIRAHPTRAGVARAGSSSGANQTGNQPGNQPGNQTGNQTGNEAMQPFFLYLAFHGVHTPLEAPRHYVDRYNASSGNWVRDRDRAVMGGMVSAVDDAVGAVVAALQERGMWARTLVVLSTDNGGPVCHKPSAATQRGERVRESCGNNNAPLRGSKMTLWQGGVRGIGLVSGAWPGLPAGARGRRWAGMLHQTDWYPTLLGLAGLGPEAIGLGSGNTRTGPVPVDGVDQWGGIASLGQSARTELVHNIHTKNTSMPTGAIRVGRYKLLRGWPGSAGYNAWDGWLQPQESPLFTNESRWEPSPTVKPCSRAPEDTGGTAVPAAVPVPAAASPAAAAGGARTAEAASAASSQGGSSQGVASQGRGSTQGGGTHGYHCLFDVLEDPSERRDLAESPAHQDVLRQMLARYAALAESEVTRAAAGICDASAPDGYAPNRHRGVWEPWVDPVDV